MCPIPAGVWVLVLALAFLNVLGWGLFFLLRYQLFHLEEAYTILMMSKEWQDG